MGNAPMPPIGGSILAKYYIGKIIDAFLVR